LKNKIKSETNVKFKNVTQKGETPGEFKLVEGKRKKDEHCGYYLDNLNYDNELIGDPLIRDIVNISVATFAVDRRINRRVSSNTLSTRKIEITIEVSDKNKWLEAKDILENTVSFLTYDTVKYNFIESKRLAEISKNEKLDLEGDCVSLFSGGLDSLSGSKFLNDKGKRAKFVSVQHGKTKKLLEDVYGQSHPGPHIIFRVRVPSLQSSKWAREFTQFSRSLMYLSFGLAVANELNINELFIPESGIIATQIGLNDSRLVSRTVNPRFIRYYRQLIRKLFPEWDIHISNPYKYKTKSEVIKILIPEKKGLIPKTDSCSHSLWYGSKPCGMCMQCIIRNISLSVNELNPKENFHEEYVDIFNDVDLTKPDKNYNKCVEKNPKTFSDGVTFTLELIRLARDLQNLSKDELMIKYPEFMDEKLFEMYERFGKEVVFILNNSNITNNQKIFIN